MSQPPDAPAQFLTWTVVILAGVALTYAANECWKERRCIHPARNACMNNLRQIDSAKEQWALENSRPTNSTVTQFELAQYIKNGFPACPQGGTYTVGRVGANPVCTVPGHTLP